MHCPFCRHNDSKVVDSRTSDDGTSIRRRRRCTECGRRFSTLETTSISVIKRSGVTEPFDRQKIVNGVRKACQGRPVSEDDLAMLAQEVEESIRASGSAEVEAHDVGLAILPPLRRLDVVAYLRFASVYQAFEDLEDFERAIDVLRDQQAELAGQQTLVPPAARSAAPARRRSGRKDAPATPAGPAGTAAAATSTEEAHVGAGEAGTSAAEAQASAAEASAGADNASVGSGEPSAGTADTSSRPAPGSKGASRRKTSDRSASGAAEGDDAPEGTGGRSAAPRRRRTRKPAETVTQPRLL